jgi:hypothetical protein
MRFSLLLLGLYPLFSPSLVQASVSPGFGPPSFQEWFHYYRAEMAAAASECQTEINNYTANPYNYKRLPGQFDTPCAIVENCILKNLRDSVKANMASSAVLLGFLPTIMALMGPAMTEIVPLLVERPLLGSLIAFGSPTTTPVPLFKPLKLEAAAPSALTIALRQKLMSVRRGSGGALAVGVSVLEYALVIGAMANQIDNTLMLGRRVIIAWRCSYNVAGQLLFWIILGVFGYWMAAVSFRVRMRRPAATDALAHRGINEAESKRPTTRTNKMEPSGAKRLVRRLRRVAQMELTPRIFRSGSVYLRQIEQHSLMAETIYLVASLFTLAHLVYGTLIFSSLLFVSTTEAVLVVVRYFITSLVCRLVLFLELDSMEKLEKMNG